MAVNSDVWNTSDNYGADLTGTLSGDAASGPEYVGTPAPPAPAPGIGGVDYAATLGAPQPFNWQASLGGFQAAGLAQKQQAMPPFKSFTMKADGTFKAEGDQSMLADVMAQLTDLQTMKSAAMARVAQLRQQEASGSPLIDALSQFAGNMAANDPTMPGWVRALGATNLAMGPQGIKRERMEEENRALAFTKAENDVATDVLKYQEWQRTTEDKLKQQEINQEKAIDAQVRAFLSNARIIASKGGGPMDKDAFEALANAYGVPPERIAPAYAAHQDQAKTALTGLDTTAARGLAVQRNLASFKDTLKRNFENEVAFPHKIEAIDHAFRNSVSPTKMAFDETLAAHKASIATAAASDKELKVLGPTVQKNLTQASATNQYLGTVEDMLSQPEFAQVQGPLFQFVPGKNGELGEVKFNPQAALPKQFQNVDKTVVDSMIAHEIPRLLTLLLNGQSGGASILRQQIGKKLVEDMGITGGVRADQALEILKIVRDTNNTSVASQMRGKPYADWSRLQDWIGATDPRNDYFFRGRMDAFGKPIPNFPDPYTPRTPATTPQAAAPAATGYTPSNVKWDGKNWTDGTHKWDANGKLVK